MYNPQQEKTFGILAHLFGLGALIIPVVGGAVGTLVWWLIKKDEYELVDDQGKEALNFQITLGIGSLIGWALWWIPFLGPLIITGLQIVNIIFVVLAILAVNGGDKYRYPFSLKLVP